MLHRILLFIKVLENWQKPPHIIPSEELFISQFLQFFCEFNLDISKSFSLLNNNSGVYKNLYYFL